MNPFEALHMRMTKHVQQWLGRIRQRRTVLNRSKRPDCSSTAVFGVHPEWFASTKLNRFEGVHKGCSLLNSLVLVSLFMQMYTIQVHAEKAGGASR